MCRPGWTADTLHVKARVTLFLAALLSVCAVACDSAVAYLPDVEILPAHEASPGALAVGQSDFAFNLAEPSVHAGRTDFLITNGGLEPHEFVIVPVDGDRYGTPVGEHEALEPGQSAVLRATLQAGRYRVVCLLLQPGPDPKSHFALGMAADLLVRP